jgi:hypothetical protein
MTQAERILLKFGGARELHALLKSIGRPRNLATIYKWTYPRPKGRGGLIPTSAWPDLHLAARMAGIILTPADLDHRDILLKKKDLEPYT